MTLPKDERDRFWSETEKRRMKTPAMNDIRRAKVGFVKPELRVKAKHLRGSGMLRHASLSALMFQAGALHPRIETI